MNQNISTITPSLFLLLFSLQLFSIDAFGQPAKREMSVYFETNEYVNFEFNKIEQFIDSLPFSTRARITGYADYQGNVEDNKVLSRNRATAVSKRIREAFPQKVKIAAIEGRGEIATEEESEEGVREHRRVDVLFTWEEPVEEEQIIEEEETFEIDELTKENIVLKGLSFIPGRHFPTPQSMPELEKLAKTMKKYPSLNIEIQGFICCEYDMEDGMDNDTGEPFLSRNRAEYVFDYLVEQGIDPDRMEFIGLGSTQPKVFPEVTDADRQANRRVEIKITEM